MGGQLQDSLLRRLSNREVQQLTDDEIARLEAVTAVKRRQLHVIDQCWGMPGPAASGAIPLDAAIAREHATARYRL